MVELWEGESNVVKVEESFGSWESLIGRLDEEEFDFDLFFLILGGIFTVKSLFGSELAVEANAPAPATSGSLGLDDSFY